MTDWQEYGLCRQTDPEIYFPEKGGSTRAAKRMCLDCTVKSECLSAALETDERFGVWGGASERERRKMQRDIESGATTIEAVTCFGVAAHS